MPEKRENKTRERREPFEPGRAGKNHMHACVCVILSLPFPLFSFELPTLDTCKKKGPKWGNEGVHGTTLVPSSMELSPSRVRFTNSPRAIPQIYVDASFSFIFSHFFLFFFVSWGNEVFPVWLRVSHCGQINAKRYVNQIKSKARTAPHPLIHNHTHARTHTHSTVTDVGNERSSDRK